MKSAQYSCHILIKLEFFLRDLKKWIRSFIEIRQEGPSRSMWKDRHD